MGTASIDFKFFDLIEKPLVDIYKSPLTTGEILKKVPDLELKLTVFTKPMSIIKDIDQK